MKFFIPMLSLGPQGGNRVLIELANALVVKGHEVIILTTKMHMHCIYPIHDKINIIFVGGKSKFSYLLVLFLTAFVHDYDVIFANHFSTYIPSFLSKLIFKKKLYYLVQDLEYNFHHGISRYIARYLCRMSYNERNLISANDYLTSKLISLGYAPSLTINVGVSESFFSSKNDSSKKIKSYDLVHFARHQPHKRLDLFLEMATILNGMDKNLKFIALSNDDIAIAKLEDFSHLITVVKPKNDQELIEYIDQSKIYFLCSDHEGFSLPPLECMARGKPLALFECGGPSVYANPSNSILLNREDMIMSATKIYNTLMSEGTYNDLSLAAIETANRFTLSAAVYSVTRLFDE